jgi:TonB family protein
MKIPQTLWLALICIFLAGTVETRAGEDRQLSIRVTTPPIYPRALLKKKINGTVVVEFIVDQYGVVREAHAVRSTHPGFDQAACDAILSWRFNPGLKNGRAVNVRAQQELSFSVPVHEPVYPYAQLLAGQDGTATVGLWLNANNELIRSVVLKASDPIFGKAALANLEDEYATSPPLSETRAGGMHEMTPYIFKANGRGSLTVSASTKAILKLLKKPNASFLAEADLDKPLVAVEKDEPLFPLALRETHTTGSVVVEFFIDREGVPQLPRVVEASQEDFGYAAVQAVAAWRFEPPLKNGKPVIMRTRLPFTFQFQENVEVRIVPPHEIKP